jgi:hypothetical protein
VFWNTHTRRLGNTEVQVLSCKEVLPHVEEMPGPEQAPRRAVNGAGNGQVVWGSSLGARLRAGIARG